MGTNVYIDGLNLYYGAVKNTPHKWLDLEAVARRLVPADSIKRIRYFTATLKPIGGSTAALQRQNVYLRALRTNPLIDIHLGHFRSDPAWRPISTGPWSDITRPRLRPRRLIELAQEMIEPRLDQPPKVLITKMEEKGSDVNLAAHLLYDVLVHNVNKVLVISNDADFAEPIRLAVTHGAVVGVVNPHRKNPMSRHLRKVASFDLQLRPGTLPNCQLPSPIYDRKGRQIHRPAGW